MSAAASEHCRGMGSAPLRRAKAAHAWLRRGLWDPLIVRDESAAPVAGQPAGPRLTTLVHEARRFVASV
jgi:hypothetical protein